jgi:hypothetical protein
MRVCLLREQGSTVQELTHSCYSWDPCHPQFVRFIPFVFTLIDIVRSSLKSSTILLCGTVRQLLLLFGIGNFAILESHSIPHASRTCSVQRNNFRLVYLVFSVWVSKFMLNQAGLSLMKQEGSTPVGLHLNLADFPNLVDGSLSYGNCAWSRKSQGYPWSWTIRHFNPAINPSLYVINILLKFKVRRVNTN